MGWNHGIQGYSCPRGTEELRTTFCHTKCCARTIAPLNYQDNSRAVFQPPERTRSTVAKPSTKRVTCAPGTEYECKTCPSGWQNYHQGHGVYQFATSARGRQLSLSVASGHFTSFCVVDREFVATRHSGGVAMGQIQQRPPSLAVPLSNFRKYMFYTKDWREVCALFSTRPGYSGPTTRAPSP